MVPVSKMRHVAFLLRAFCNDEVVQAVIIKHGVTTFRIARAKERFYLSPSPGGWRDLMLNFHIEVGGVSHICELQVVHETLLKARSGLPGHAIYGRVRNASELIEYKMGNAISAAALRLASASMAAQ